MTAAVESLIPVSLPSGHFHDPYTYIWHISLNKYNCHIVNVCHTTNMLNGHIDPIFSYNYTRTQPNAMYTSHITAIYVLHINMPIKLGTYAKHLMGIYERCIHIYEPHMKSLQSTTGQGTLYTYLTYITRQMWLPHYMCHCTATIEYIWTPL